MDEPLLKTFSVKKESVIRSLAIQGIIGLTFTLGLPAGMLYLFVALGRPGVVNGILPFLTPIATALVAGALFFVFLFAVLVLLQMKVMAHSIKLDDYGLTIDKMWGSEKLSWSDVADLMDIRHLTRRDVLLRLWDGRRIQLSPPLKEADEIRSVIEKRAVKSIGAAASKKEKCELNWKLARAEAVHGLRMTLLTFAVIAFYFFAYSLFQTVRPPMLALFSADKATVSQQKGSYLTGFSLNNFGREFRGLSVTLSGSAITSGIVTNPRLLLETRATDYPSPTEYKRVVVPFAFDRGKRVWWADINQVAIAHEDDFLAQPLRLFLRNGRLAAHSTRVELFGDVTRTGKSTLNVKFVPAGSVNAQVSSKIALLASVESSGSNNPIASVDVPGNYPISRYPQARISKLDTTTARFDSDQPADAIEKYYEKELRHKGWKVKRSRLEGRMQELTARNGPRRMSIMLVTGTCPTTEIIFDSWN